MLSGQNSASFFVNYHKKVVTAASSDSNCTETGVQVILTIENFQINFFTKQSYVFTKMTWLNWVTGRWASFMRIFLIIYHASHGTLAAECEAFEEQGKSTELDLPAFIICRLCSNFPFSFKLVPSKTYAPFIQVCYYLTFYERLCFAWPLNRAAAPPEVLTETGVSF